MTLHGCVTAELTCSTAHACRLHVAWPLGYFCSVRIYKLHLEKLGRVVCGYVLSAATDSRQQSHPEYSRKIGKVFNSIYGQNKRIQLYLVGFAKPLMNLSEGQIEFFFKRAVSSSGGSYEESGSRKASKDTIKCLAIQPSTSNGQWARKGNLKHRARDHF